MSELLIEDAAMREALDRIGRTPDGRMLYLFLQKQLSGVPLNPDRDALRQIHGHRMLAAELMAAMAKGIRNGNDGRDPTERPITFLSREPARVERRTGARGWLRDNDPELAEPAAGT